MFLLQKYEIYKNYQLNFYRQKQNILSAKLSLTPRYGGSLVTALKIKKEISGVVRSFLFRAKASYSCHCFNVLISSIDSFFILKDPHKMPSYSSKTL